MRANSAIAPGQAREGAGFGSTASLVGIRLAQALGWRVGAGVLLFTACPLWFVVWLMWETIIGTPHCNAWPDRAGQLVEICYSYAGDRLISVPALGFAVLFTAGAVGLWRRGGAVRDVEILAEQVEGSAAD